MLSRKGAWDRSRLWAEGVSLTLQARDPWLSSDFLGLEDTAECDAKLTAELTWSGADVEEEKVCVSVNAVGVQDCRR